MEIRRWFCYIFIKCVVVQYLTAKTVSLNELIAAEARAKGGTDNIDIQRPKSTDPKAKPISLNEISTAAEPKARRDPLKITTKKLTDLLKRLPLFKRLAYSGTTRRLKQDKAIVARPLSRDEKISPLRYRKEFKIKSPLKPRKLKVAERSRHKRKNQSVKREISGNDHLKKKYIPLFKSFNILFNSLFDSDSGDSNKIKTKIYKRKRFNSQDSISKEISSRLTNSISQEKTTPASASFSTKISSNTKNLPPSEDNDYSTHGPDTSVPVLLPRNTLSRRRDNNGSSKRSSSSYNRNFERNFTRNHGTDEHNTGIGKNSTYAASYENDTYSTTRNDTSSLGYSRRERYRNYTENSTNRKATQFQKDETTQDSFGENKFETGRNETESENILREPVRRLRGSVSENKNTLDERPIPKTTHEKTYEESILSTTNDGTDYKRFSNKSSSDTPENEKIRSRNETVIFIESHYPHTENSSEGTGKKTPVVLIFDGYSVTRDKNGKNKVLGKTMHI